MAKATAPILSQMGFIRCFQHFSLKGTIEEQTTETEVLIWLANSSSYIWPHCQRVAVSGCCWCLLTSHRIKDRAGFLSIESIYVVEECGSQTEWEGVAWLEGFPQNDFAANISGPEYCLKVSGQRVGGRKTICYYFCSMFGFPSCFVLLVWHLSLGWEWP